MGNKILIRTNDIPVKLRYLLGHEMYNKII